MPIFRLDPNDFNFPDPSLSRADGLLAIGGDLRPERLMKAYESGIFPWYNPGEPILWWSLDPRFVLFPEELKVSKSMRPYFNQKKFKVTLNHCFREVMVNCQRVQRPGQYEGSWISEEMVDAYSRLNELGAAHSVEVWEEEELVGGLYGISLGRVFFGESMFSKVSNASKFGFITLVRLLEEGGFQMIDCQQETSHLGTLGARLIPRNSFMDILAAEVNTSPTKYIWNSL